MAYLQKLIYKQKLPYIRLPLFCKAGVSSRNIFTMEERKQKLIEALKSERLRFAENGQDTTEHDIVIQFLLLGKTSCNPDKWELLDAVMGDFDTVCSNYGC